MLSGAVGRECAAEAAEVVVEGDAGGEGEQALADAGPEAVEAASVILRLAFSAFSGTRSSAVQNTAISSRSRSELLI
jgi:hypothetical protein